MKLYAIPLLLLVGAAPAYADTIFSVGQKVEVLNASTGQWDPVTVKAVSGSGADMEYTIHSEDPGVFDRTVGGEILRNPGGAVQVAHATAPAREVSNMTNGVPNAFGRAPGSIRMNGNGTFADGTNPLAKFTPAKPYDAESEPIPEDPDVAGVPPASPPR
jgi:hypothetical protein